MPSKGQVQADRDAAARNQRALVSIRLAVREALDADLTAEDAAKAFAEVLRERGLLGTAGRHRGSIGAEEIAPMPPSPFDLDVAALVMLLQSRVPLLRSVPALKARQLAAGGLMRTVALLIGIGHLRRSRRGDVIGILARQHWETWLVALYVLLKGDPAIEELRADDVFWSRQLAEAVEGFPLAKHLAEWKGKPEKLNYLKIAKALGPLLVAAGDPAKTDVVTAYNYVYRGQSQAFVHSGLRAMSRYVDDSDPVSLSVLTDPPIPGSAEGIEQVAAAHSAHLAYHVFKAFGIGTDDVEAIASRLSAH